MTQLGVERAGTPALLRIPVSAPQLDYGQQVKLTGAGRPGLRLAAWRAVWGALKANLYQPARLLYFAAVMGLAVRAAAGQYTPHERRRR